MATDEQMVEYTISQRERSGTVTVTSDVTVTGVEAQAAYDAALMVKALLEAWDSSLQAYGYGNTGGGVTDDDRAVSAFADELRYMGVGVTRRLGTGVEIEKVAA